MDALLQDIRYSIRTLAQSPGFTLVAVVCLALGIGVNTTIFSVVDTAVIRPFPFADAERLVMLRTTLPRSGIEDAGTSYPNFRDWQQQNRVFSGMAAQGYMSLTLQDGTEPERLEGATVTWNLFPLLGVQPAVGRGFREDEDRAGAPGAAILSDDVWQRRYQRNPSVLGRSILVNGRPHVVVGIMPHRFGFPQRQQIWVPVVPIEHASPRRNLSLVVYARLAPGATLEQARTEATAIARRLEALDVDNAGYSAGVSTLREKFMPASISLVILTMMGAVSLVLIIACSNVANLLLARATARHREISIRAALGAGRGRIVRQMLTESAILGMLSVPIGIALAYVGLDLIDRGVPPERPVPYYIHWAIDRRAMIYAASVSMLTALVFGMVPAVQASRGNLQDALKDGRSAASGASRSRLRNSFVVAQMALSVILLVGAALFVKSFMNLQRASGGFDTAPLLALRVYMAGDQYEAEEAKTRRVDDIARRIEGLPGVEAVGASNLIPLDGGGDMGPIEIEGRPAHRGEEPRIFYTGVTAHFMETLAVGVSSGRTFTDAEGSTRSRVAIVNQSMAQRFWPNGGAIGQRFRHVHDASTDWLTVIGVVPDIASDRIPDQKPTPSAYLPFPYMAERNTGLIVRTSGDPASLSSAIREAVRASDPTLPVFRVETMEKVRRLGFWQDRLFGWMFSIFGMLALVLAAIGVYGVLSYSVTQRTQEIGVRMALGAGRHDVYRLVIGQGMKLAAAGVALGLAGALGVTRIIASLLYNVSVTDGLSFSAVALFLALVAAVASYIPARRAVAVDPIVALRNE